MGAGADIVASEAVARYTSEMVIAVYTNRLFGHRISNLQTGHPEYLGRYWRKLFHPDPAAQARFCLETNDCYWTLSMSRKMI